MKKVLQKISHGLPIGANLGLALALSTALFSVTAAAQETIGPGMVYYRDQTTGYHVVVADLNSERTEVRVTHPRNSGEDMKTVAQHALEEGATVAINANYFAIGTPYPCGAARGFGNQYTAGYPDGNNCRTTLGWTRGAAAIFDSFGREHDPSLNPQYTELATGGGYLLSNGQRRDWNHAKLEEGRDCAAVGVSGDRAKFIFVVTDMYTCRGYNLQTALLNAGARDAIHLDGGGSTKMWINGRYVNNQREDRRPPVVIFARPGQGPGPTCPTGDRWYGAGKYCTDSGIVNGEPNTLYSCAIQGGPATLVEHCSPCCVQEDPGIDDHCAAPGPACPTGELWYGAGKYCTESGICGGEPDTLYYCASPGGPATLVEHCDLGCVQEDPGIDDHCAGGSSFPPATAGSEPAGTAAATGCSARPIPIPIIVAKVLGRRR